MNTRAPGTQEIRVLLVDDSPIALELTGRMLATAPEVRVVGAVTSAAEALALIPKARPHVICTELHMPKMNGVEFTRAVLALYPLPILAFSVSVQKEQTHNIFQMLEAGAIDVLAKPRGGLESDFGVITYDLVAKIRILAGVKVIGRGWAAADAPAMPGKIPMRATMGAAPRIVGIGASTGGPQALQAVLGGLPPAFPLPLVCVQHIAEGFMQGLVDWLACCCRIGVRTAVEGAYPQPGTAYFPPEGRHVEIDERGAFRCSGALSVSGHRPSVDLAFDSLALRYGAATIGVLLTGMGVDGAEGLLDIARAGGFTIAQDEKSSVVFGMPAQAIKLGAARRVLPLGQIAPALIQAAAASVSNTEAGRK